MKKAIFVIIAVAAVTVLIPFLIIYNTSGFYKGENPENAASNPTSDDTLINVYIKNEDRVESMSINDYLTGVVSAEMPADFNEEAIKAQAVAARSYLISHINSYKNGAYPENHKGADACTDHTHCQAWMSEQARKAAWSADKADSNMEKIKKAVRDTAGEVMVYDGEVINAVFHSTSGGKTENAVDVWGSDVPYLKSVESEGDIQSPKYNSDLAVEVEEYKSTVAAALGEAVDWSKGLFSDIVRSDAGGIVSMTVGGVTIKGSKLREMFSLRSANVVLEEKDGVIYMTVKGYGHGVGMSQYGANYLAGIGKDYKEILKTYYTGVEVADNSLSQ